MQEQLTTLEAQLQEKEQLVAALTERLEQAAEQLDRLHRTGADRAMRTGGGGFPAEMVEQQKQLVDDLQRSVQQWEDMQPGAMLDYPPPTLTVIRTGFLLQEGLYDEARRELVARIAADPREPTLHHLIGQVYQRTGRADLAAEAFAEADFLTRRTP